MENTPPTLEIRVCETFYLEPPEVVEIFDVNPIFFLGDSWTTREILPYAISNPANGPNQFLYGFTNSSAYSS